MNVELMGITDRPEGAVSVTRIHTPTGEVRQHVAKANTFSDFALFIYYYIQNFQFKTIDGTVAGGAFENLAFFKKTEPISRASICPGKPIALMGYELESVKRDITSTMVAVVERSGKEYYHTKASFRSYIGTHGVYGNSFTFTGTFDSVGFYSTYYGEGAIGGGVNRLYTSFVDLGEDFVMTEEDMVIVDYDIYIPKDSGSGIVFNDTLDMKGTPTTVTATLLPSVINDLGGGKFNVAMFGNLSNGTPNSGVTIDYETKRSWLIDEVGKITRRNELTSGAHVRWTNTLNTLSCKSYSTDQLTFTFDPPVSKNLGEKFSFNYDFLLDYGYTPFVPSLVTDPYWGDVVTLIDGNGTVGTNDYTCVKGSTITWESDYWDGQVPGLVTDTVQLYGKNTVSLPSNYTRMTVGIPESMLERKYTIEISVWLDPAEGTGGYVGIMDFLTPERSYFKIGEWNHVQILTTPYSANQAQFVAFINGKVWIGYSSTEFDNMSIMRFGGNLVGKKRYVWANLRITKGHRASLPWKEPTGSYPTTGS